MSMYGHFPPSGGSLPSVPGADQIPEVRPWIRLWARTVDQFLAVVPIALFVAFIAPGLIRLPLLLWLLLTVTTVLLNALLLSTWGTTVGKWLLNTRVRTEDGEKLSFGDALARELEVLIRGQALGIPVLSLIALAVAYGTITSTGAAPWDKGEHAVATKVTHGPVSILGGTVATIIIAVVFLLSYMAQ